MCAVEAFPACPPPPPFGLGRSRDKVTFDPALDDAPLIAARTALSQGRWTDLRALLAETGENWDRRGHRLVVLGEAPSTVAWAEDWLLAEPDSADAAALLACATVFRAAEGRVDPDRARELCLAAADMTPADPTPWLGLLVLARHTGTEDEQDRAFDQVRGRHRTHHHAHHLMTACLAERRRTDVDGPYHEVYEFTDWAAKEAPAGSPWPCCPWWRTPSATGSSPGPAASPTSRRARPTGTAGGPARAWRWPSTGGSNGTAVTTRASAWT